MNAKAAAVDRKSPLEVRSSLGSKATRDVSGALNALLADFFALYLKTKNFHWHVSGPHFRDYHLLLDEQADQLFATTDVIAERVRKIGGTTLRSIGHVGRLLPRIDGVGAIHVGLAARHHLDALGRGADDPVDLEARLADRLADPGDHALTQIDRITGWLVALGDKRKRQRIARERDVDRLRGLDLRERIGRALRNGPRGNQA